MHGPKTRVLIVDDSMMMRHVLKDMLSTDPQIEVVGVAVDPYDAREKILALRPDVMTLDIEMPKMDGVTFLAKLMQHHPVRTVVISSLTPEGSKMALKALSVGAIDVLEKPRLDMHRGMREMAATLTQRVRVAAEARLVPHATPPEPRRPSLAMPRSGLGTYSHRLIAVVASTGGTEAIKVLLSGLPVDSPGVVIVQHMPPVFTRNFAIHLKELTGLDVREAAADDEVSPGIVLIAPGGYHMEAERRGGVYRIRLHEEPPLHGVRPAGDYLFRSVARAAGANGLGVILTGMGRDGADGLFEMKKAGAFTLAQDEQSSVVYGMPKEAVRLGAVSKVLPLGEIASAVTAHFMGEQRQHAA